jgi:hypothetical protein
MRKHDRTTYEIWKNLLKPRLGKSLAKTESAVKSLRRFNSRRRFAFHRDKNVSEIHSKMRSPRSRYYAETYMHANITFGFLHRLTLNHRRKLIHSRENLRP